MTFRAWLNTGKYVHVTAPSEQEALRKLTRTQRKRVTLVKLVKP